MVNVIIDALIVTRTIGVDRAGALNLIMRFPFWRDFLNITRIVELLFPLVEVSQRFGLILQSLSSGFMFAEFQWASRATVPEGFHISRSSHPCCLG
jgi:hypothetical protein